MTAMSREGLKRSISGESSQFTQQGLPVSWITLFGTSKLTWHSSKNLGFTWMILIHPPFHPPFQSLHILLKQKVTDKFKTTSNINNYRSRVIFIGLWDDQLQSTGIKSRTGAFSNRPKCKIDFQHHKGLICSLCRTLKALKSPFNQQNCPFLLQHTLQFWTAVTSWLLRSKALQCPFRVVTDYHSTCCDIQDCPWQKRKKTK